MPGFTEIGNLEQDLKIKIQQRAQKVQELKCVAIEDWRDIAPETTANIIKVDGKRLLYISMMKGQLFTINPGLW